jgi:hypothetical protein
MISCRKRPFFGHLPTEKKFAGLDKLGHGRAKPVDEKKHLAADKSLHTRIETLGLAAVTCAF